VSPEKGHWRIETRRIVRVPTTPEECGLCGCWQLVAVLRDCVELGPEKRKPEDSVGYYASSLAYGETTDEGMLADIRGHWAGIENGTHLMRDVSFGEDACRVADRTAAHALASIRNLAVGLYELERSKGRASKAGCKSHCRRMTFAQAHGMLS
jgi:hypothetical protein